MLENVHDTLAQLSGIRVISYDRSGLGDSEFGHPDLDAKKEIDILKSALDKLGYNKNFIHISFSYGELLVQYFAYTYPDIVKGLLLLDPMNIRFVDRYGLTRLKNTFPVIQNPQSKLKKTIVQMFVHKTAIAQVDFFVL